MLSNWDTQEADFLANGLVTEDVMTAIGMPELPGNASENPKDMRPASHCRAIYLSNSAFLSRRQRLKQEEKDKKRMEAQAKQEIQREAKAEKTGN